MSISTSDCNGWFDIDSSSGVVSVNGGNLDYESATSCDIVINAESADGSDTDSSTISIAITDHDEFDVGAVTDSDTDANTVAENAADDATVGVTGSASDADGSTNAITYSLSIDTNACDGWFDIDSSSGVVSVDGGNLDYESATSCDIVITATSADGSDSDSDTITISITDFDESDVTAPTDSRLVVQ